MNEPTGLPEDSRPEDAAPAPADPGQPRRVLLVVDDEEGPRQSLRLVFQDTYEVLVASSGAAALEVARQRSVDAALVDINMAGMSGIDLLSLLKAQDPGLEVSILTAYASLETAKQAVRLGASDYVTKPFDVQAIRETVAKMMMRREVQERARQGLNRLQGVEAEMLELRHRSELLRTRGQIYGDVLHDINRPLATIVGHLSLLNERLKTVESLDAKGLDKLRERLQSLNRQADNIAGIVHRYLGCLRQETGGVNVADVSQVLADLRDLLKIYPVARGHDVNLQFPPAAVVARVNGTDLLQILLNLTVNALHASPRGAAVEVAALWPEPPLDLAHWTEGPGRRLLRAPEFTTQNPLITLAVRDQGTGMPAEVVGQLFDAPTARRTGQGSGLGLAIVRRLVFLSAGALALESKPGEGTCVWVFLPALDPAALPRP
jgi:two-component system, sensor histidine kinase and response regulator